MKNGSNYCSVHKNKLVDDQKEKFWNEIEAVSIQKKRSMKKPDFFLFTMIGRNNLPMYV